jgi:hypothetical protein
MPSGKILILDDEPNILVSLSRALELEGRPSSRPSRYCAPGQIRAFGSPHIDAPTANLNSHRRIQSGVGP